MKYSGIVGLSAMLLFCMVANVAIAAEGVEVVTAEGKVTAEDSAGKLAKPVHSKSVVESGNILATGADARAVVKVSNDGFVVMGKNSKVELTPSTRDKPGFFRQISGIVYYAINSIKGKRRAVEVRTATTTIGIRGTRFIVTETDDSKEIGMRKGEINVASESGGDFEIHKQDVKDEFAAYKRESQAAMEKSAKEFEDYKQQTEKEFVEFKKEFSLSADRMATFEGNRVVEKPLSEESRMNMQSFEDYAGEWLKKVRD